MFGREHLCIWILWRTLMVEKILWQGPVSPVCTRMDDYILHSKCSLFLPPVMWINSHIWCLCVSGLFSLFLWSILQRFCISFGSFFLIENLFKFYFETHCHWYIEMLYTHTHTHTHTYICSKFLKYYKFY